MVRDAVTLEDGSLVGYFYFFDAGRLLKMNAQTGHVVSLYDICGKGHLDEFKDKIDSASGHGVVLHPEVGERTIDMHFVATKSPACGFRQWTQLITEFHTSARCCGSVCLQQMELFN